MTQPTSIREWERQLADWPDSQFRPREDGPDRIAIFHSRHPRDEERARLAQAQNGCRYLSGDTPAGQAVRKAELSDGEKRTLVGLVRTRTALAATGRVELYCAQGRQDPDFLTYQVAPLLGRESVTHINGVPAPSLFAASKDRFSDALFASEIVRDKPHLPDWRQPGGFYTGNPLEPKTELPKPVQNLVETFSRDAARDRFAREAAKRAEQRRERQHQRRDEWER